MAGRSALSSLSFKQQVQGVVSHIPKGKVMTYGQIATLCGRPSAARIVGGIAHYGDPNLPWQRVVKQDGSLAEGFPGGVAGHESVLKQDGVETMNGKVDMERCLWRPNLGVRS